MEFIIQLAIVAITSLALSAVCFKLNMLTIGGSVASFCTGAFVGVFGSIEWFLLLLVFTIMGFAATKMDFERKKKDGTQEGISGERSHLNVLGVGVPPCIVVAIAFAFGDHGLMMTAAFVSTMAVAAADTIASEIGSKDKKVWLITNFKKVAPGTDGGISALGTVAALAASAAASVLGWVLIYGTLDAYLLIPTFAGFAGCMLDSILGATLESKKIITKYTNNASTALMGACIGAAICTLL